MHSVPESLNRIVEGGRSQQDGGGEANVSQAEPEAGPEMALEGRTKRKGRRVVGEGQTRRWHWREGERGKGGE
jgi:hypothetical protein